MKPTFVPPNWVFGPVWTVLYLLMGISLYLVWMQQSKRSKQLAFAFFGLQLVLNTAWSVVFFGFHQPVTAVAVIFALLVAIAATMVQFWQFSRRAVYLLVPYLLWVSFATALTIGIAILNPHANRITSYEQCAHQGGSVLTTYPSVCVTRDGQRFTATKPPAGLTSLKINEWSITVPLTDSLSDAFYSYDAKNDEITLTTAKLESLRHGFSGCMSGLHALYYKHDGTKLVEQHHIETLCAPVANDAGRQIEQIQANLRAAASQAKS